MFACLVTQLQVLWVALLSHVLSRLRTDTVSGCLTLDVGFEFGQHVPQLRRCGRGMTCAASRGVCQDALPEKLTSRFHAWVSSSRLPMPAMSSEARA